MTVSTTAATRPLTTSRLRLRALTRADALSIATLAGAWEVASMTGRIPYPYSEQQALQWVTDLASGEVVFGIERGGSLIGICGYTAGNDGSAELGYWIGQDFWGQGFATEAARALIAYGFAKGGVRTFVCGHFADNPASARVIAKLGFTHVGDYMAWCEAQQCERRAERYVRRRNLLATLKALAS